MSGYKSLSERNKERALPIKIDGVEFASYGDAATQLGCSKETLGKHVRKLRNSPLSESTVTIQFHKTITIRKIKR